MERNCKMREEDFEELKDIVVVYHGGCPDGFTAAWAAWKKFGDKASYVPCKHSEKGYELADEIEGADVYVLDFSFPIDKIEKLKENNKSFTLLDHHLSAMDKLKDIEGCTFDMNRSGAGIAWDYFHPNTDRPKLINYIEDRDLWKNSLPFSEEVAAFIELFPKDIDSWESLHESMEKAFFEVVVHIGSNLKNYKNLHIEKLCKKALTVELLGIEALCINSADWQSEIGSSLSGEAETFVIIWHQTKDGSFRYSLRSHSKHGMDVSEIAAVFGGGGHEHAAAFNSDKIEFTIMK